MLALAALFVWLSSLVWHNGSGVGLDRTLSRLTVVGAVAEVLAEGKPLEPRPRKAVHLGSATVVVILATALALVALAWRDWLGAVLALAGPGVTGALTEYVLKPLVTPERLVDGRAFPSGHAGGASAVALVAVILVNRRWGRVPALILAPLAVLPVLAVSHALVRLGFHYPTDVVGGVLLALVVVLALVTALSVLGRPTAGARSGADPWAMGPAPHP